MLRTLAFNIMLHVAVGSLIIGILGIHEITYNEENSITSKYLKMLATDVQEKVEIIDQILTHKEAKDLMLQMINDQINFEKYKNLCNWESNHSCDETICQDTLDHLESKKHQVLDIIREAKHSGMNLRVTGSFEIVLEEKY